MDVIIRNTIEQMIEKFEFGHNFMVKDIIKEFQENIIYQAEYKVLEEYYESDKSEIHSILLSILLKNKNITKVGVPDSDKPLDCTFIKK